MPGVCIQRLVMVDHRKMRIDKFRQLPKGAMFAQNFKNGSPGTYSGRLGQP